MPPYTIQVRGLPEETSENAVRDFFSRVGEVTECALNGTAATLSFDNADDFNEALNMDGIEFEKGATIQVEKKEAEKTEEEQQKHEQNEASGDNCNDNANGAKTAEGDDAAPAESRKRFREEFKIAVRHLAENTTEQQLRDLFEPLGAISDLFLEPRRRYAFVGFDNAESLEAALQMTGREVNGVAIEVEKKRTGPRENVLECKVVAKGLPPNTTEDALRAFFAPAGEPVDLFIHDKKQFAFIGFADEQACSAALRLSGAELDGHRLEIERRQRQRCFKCNKEGHVALQCRAADQTCRNCGRPGHLARDCRAPPRDYDRRGGYNNNNGAGNNIDRRDYERRDYDRRGGYNNNNNNNNNTNNDRRDYERRDYEKRDYDRRRARSRSDSYERHHRRRSRSRSPKRVARDRDRSRSPQRRRY